MAKFTVTFWEKITYTQVIEAASEDDALDEMEYLCSESLVDGVSQGFSAKLAIQHEDA